jgi:S-(hydroxymethyl)glutathione dehydrogenase/alcohol dehydrogenase
VKPPRHPRFREKTMKAAILVEQNTPLVVADVEIPKLDVGQVLVKIEYSGICGKQLDEISGKRGEDPYLPHMLGHEGAGIVADVGPGVRKVKIGDHVVLHWMKGMGIDSTPPTFKRNGTVVNAGLITTFSEYTVASENRITPIPDSLKFDVACLLGCAVTTGLGIVFRDAGLIPGQSIAVFGVGGIGLNVVQGAALVNAYPIVAIDLHEDKLERAAAFGATHTFNPASSDLTAFLSDLTAGRGLDVAVDTTGVSDVCTTAFNQTSSRGKTILAGVLHHKNPVTLDAYPLNGGRQIMGSHGGDTNPDVDIPRYIKLHQLGRLMLEEQITGRYSLEEINDAIDSARQGRAGRSVISLSPETPSPVKGERESLSGRG